MLNLTLPLVKVCNLLIKRLLNFSFLGAKGNLITNDFVSLNHHFCINSSSFFSLNLKKVSLINLAGQSACKNFVFILLSSLSKSVVIFLGSMQFTGNSVSFIIGWILKLQWTRNFANFVNTGVEMLITLSNNFGI